MAVNPFTKQSYSDPTDVFKKKKKSDLPPALQPIPSPFVGGTPKLPNLPTLPSLEDYGGVTQADLNKMRRQGIDPFSREGLRKLSEQDIAAQEKLSKGEAITEKQKAAMEAAALLLNKPSAEAEKIRNALVGGLNVGEVLGGAGAKAAAGAAGGAAGGAVAGIFTGGVASLPLAAAAGSAGAIGGFFYGIYSGLKDQSQKMIVAEYTSYSDSLTNIKSIIANAGRDPVEAINLYQIELAKIDAAERKLKKEDERKWLSTTKNQLIKIEDFNRYQRENTRQMLLLAIADPTTIQNFEMPTTTGAIA